MYRKLSWLTAALALILWAGLPSVSLADDDRQGRHVTHHKHDRHYGHHRHHRDYRHRDFRHRDFDRRHGARHRRFERHGHRHFRHGTRKYVYDDGHCRVTVKHGKYGSKKSVRCRHGHGRAHRYRHGHGRGYGYRHGYGGVAFVVPRQVVAEALDHAPDGRGIVWDQPREGARVEVVPGRIERERDGRYCREYLATATVAGETQEVYGRACRQADGAWEIVQ